MKGMYTELLRQAPLVATGCLVVSILDTRLLNKGVSNPTVCNVLYKL